MIELLTEDGETLLTEDSESLLIEDIVIPEPPPIPLRTRTIVELCDINFNKLHELEAGLFEAVIRRNEPGQWRLDCHLDEVRPDLLMQVNAVLVRDERRIVFAGYRSAGDSSSEGGTMREIDDAGRRASIEGRDCWHWFTSRVVYPDPTVDMGWSLAADVRTGNGGAVVAGYIAANCGASALTARQIPGLTVVSTAVGSTGEWSGRFQTLSTLVARVATESGIVVEPTLSPVRVPTVYLRDATDRTREVVVADIADLGYAEQRDVPPRSTWVLAAGQGTGASRMFRSAGGGSGVNRIEKVTEQINATTSNELFQIANAHRREDGFAFYVSGRTSEGAAEQYRYIDDYRLGDLITVQVQGVRFSVPVTAVNIKVAAERTVETPVLGIYTPDRMKGVKRDVLNLAERFEDNIA